MSCLCDGRKVQPKHLSLLGAGVSTLPVFITYIPEADYLCNPLLGFIETILK